MLIICLKHMLSVSACVIAYKLNFWLRGKQGREGMGGRGERMGAISAGAGEVKRYGQAAPKMQVPERVLAAAAVRSQGSKAAKGEAHRERNIFKAQRVIQD